MKVGVKSSHTTRKAILSSWKRRVVLFEHVTFNIARMLDTICIWSLPGCRGQASDLKELGKMTSLGKYCSLVMRLVQSEGGAESKAKGRGNWRLVSVFNPHILIWQIHCFLWPTWCLRTYNFILLTDVCKHLKLLFLGPALKRISGGRVTWLDLHWRTIAW